MSACTAGYKGEAPKGCGTWIVPRGEAPKGFITWRVSREMGTTERGALQRDGYYREMGATERGEAPKGLSTGDLQGGDDV